MNNQIYFLDIHLINLLFFNIQNQYTNHHPYNLHYIYNDNHYDIYHHYTTDEHLLLTLYHLHELKKVSFYKEIYSRLSQKVALHVSLLFHDIGKVVEGDGSHVKLGADLLKRFNIPEPVVPFESPDFS